MPSERVAEASLDRARPRLPQVLTEEHALEHTNELLHCVRGCNVTIRWLMLHRRARMRKLPVADPEHERREAEQLLLVLMDTAQVRASPVDPPW